MPERSLRVLARQYAKGELNREEYVRSRAEFIEAVLSGSARLPVNDYPVPRSIARAEVTAESRRGQRRPNRDADGAPEMADDVTSVMLTDPTPKNVVTGADKRTVQSEFEDEPEFDLRQDRFPVRPVAIAAIVCVVVALVIVAMTRTGAPRPAASASATQDTPAAAADADASIRPDAAAPAGGPGVDLVQRFLADKNWSEDAKSGFLAQWQGLSDDQRSAAMNSGDMAQLNNAIYKKLLEERALSGIGDAQAAVARQRGLVEFAEAIGLHDPRLSVSPASPR